MESTKHQFLSTHHGTTPTRDFIPKKKSPTFSLKSSTKPQISNFSPQNSSKQTKSQRAHEQNNPKSSPTHHQNQVNPRIISLNKPRNLLSQYQEEKGQRKIRETKSKDTFFINVF
jgi:hypothetical protein